MYLRMKRSKVYNAIIIVLLVNLLLFAYLYFFKLQQFTYREPASTNAETDRLHLVEQVQQLDAEKEQQNVETFPTVAKKKPEPLIAAWESGRYFHLDRNRNTFVKDGKAFQYVSGSLHYFRVPRAYWRDRLRKYRAAGLNAISVYVEWSLHEPMPGNYSFSGETDFLHFLDLAVEEDLLVLLRPGPYICAERDLGGLPPWLLFGNYGIQLRTNDPVYQNAVKSWFDVLFAKLKPYLYGQGGPIIMVQVENEYGSYVACNKEHKLWLRDLMTSYVNDDVVLYTTDGNSLTNLQCGGIPNVYATVDFGVNQDVNRSFFQVLRKYERKGPLVNSEFYPGWLSHWEENFAYVDTDAVLNSMEQMIRLNASFNFYMFHGGTNFGFTAGANARDNVNEYLPQLTSYDYDAPLDEAGDPTEKYYAIRDLLSKYFPIPSHLEVPKPSPKGSYGTVKLEGLQSILDTPILPDSKVYTAQEPMSFEQMKLKYGYVNYKTDIPVGKDFPDPATLTVKNLNDRAIVYQNQKPIGILSRSRRIYSIPIIPQPGATLALFVENQGRINFGSKLKDIKGLLTSPQLGVHNLYNWTMVTYPFESIDWVQTAAGSSSPSAVRPPAIYRSRFTIPSLPNPPLDTYVDPTGWGKGIIFVNGINLGRYWPGTGSQVTLYVPGSMLKPGPDNWIVVFEMEFTHPELTMNFTDKPNIHKKPPGTQSLQFSF